MENTTLSIAEIIAENERRNQALITPYDPLRGVGGCGERQAVTTAGGAVVYLPAEMLRQHPSCAMMSESQLNLLRIKFDFEYWCATCVTVKDKVTSRNVKMVLNAPQRRVLGVLEEMRCAGLPIRMIMLKARQWGGSTLVQIYMAWMQIVRHKNWNSMVCGHLRDTASALRGMYSRLLREYPEEFCENGTPLTFRPYERSANVSEVNGRDSLVIAATAGSPEAVRGYDLAMAHLSEVAFFPCTQGKKPESVVRAVCGSIMLLPETVIVMESTANGVGNFFHNEWVRSKLGKSDKRAVFVPWYEIEMYQRRVDNVETLWQEMDDYERDLWEQGLTLERIAWYHEKRREYSTHEQMKAEYPTTDVEAFVATGRTIFSEVYLNRLRHHCNLTPRFCEFTRAPLTASDTLNPELREESDVGEIKVWRWRDNSAPLPRNRYVVAVDVGGTSDGADYSVIVVMDRHGEGGKPEVVAGWRGHIDHDRLAWKAVQLARYYHDALLVVESNTLETHSSGTGEYILGKVAKAYRNVYRRTGGNLGFHTNTATKERAILNLLYTVRDGGYVEHDPMAVDEMHYYERKTHGYGAIDGKHDDLLMTRAIALLVIADLPPINATAMPINVEHCTTPELITKPHVSELI